ncbi:MAG: peptide methionine sulfoxide reductase [Epulopiscium sp. Nuni2H_MBin003]|nr:MAG: peptide methionine sulfoxide reductase [Epulopiscium sp. Nuni2H_MBin003]
MKKIYLAGGCFWGLEKFLQQVYGVLKTTVGYANGNNSAQPTYKEVCTDTTGYVETVEVVYDENAVTLPFLIKTFFKAIDPTSLNRQGNDVGSQYRTGIYYTDPADEPLIREALHQLQADYQKKIMVQNLPLETYYLAEDYHQNYLENNPQGYCHIGPDIYELARTAFDPDAKYKSYSKEQLKTRLTPIQFEVTQFNATERPFSNEYDEEFGPGIYVDIVSGQPLFASSDKFNSGCGWPAFSAPISKDLITEVSDKTHGMIRTEVRTSLSNSHLGHVFDDGPADMGGERYCINSASLKFIPLDEMKQQGYEEFIPLVK